MDEVQIYGDTIKENFLDRVEAAYESYMCTGYSKQAKLRTWQHIEEWLETNEYDEAFIIEAVRNGTFKKIMKVSWLMEVSQS